MLYKLRCNIKKHLVKVDFNLGIFTVDNLEISFKSKDEIIIFDYIDETQLVGDSDIGRNQLEIFICDNNNFNLTVKNECHAFFKITKKTVFISMSIVRLMDDNADEFQGENQFYSNFGFYNPFKLECSQIIPTGFETNCHINVEGKKITRTFNDFYIDQFEKKSYDTSIIRYCKEYLANNFSNDTAIIVSQSGMDSALVGLVGDLAENKNKYTVHLDLEKNHYLGEYQSKIVDNLNGALRTFSHRVVAENQLRKDYLSNIKYQLVNLSYIVPAEVYKKWTTNLKLWSYIKDNFDSKFKKTLILQGDCTSLYQHFNGTLEYKISMLSKLFGAFRRFLFGKWGLQIGFILSMLRYKRKWERFSAVSYAFLQPSLTGSYTAKLPNFILLFKKPKNEFVELLDWFAQEYCKKSKRPTQPGFHSFIRHQILYTNVLREINSGLGQDSRLSFLAPTAILSFINHLSQPLIEIISPKKNIRRRICILGFDIDKAVSSVLVDKTLKKLFWNEVFYEHLGILAKICPSFVKILWRKRNNKNV